MKKFLLLASTALVLSSCCKDETVQVMPSPSGKYEAVVRKEGCKYESGLFQTVDIRKTNAQLVRNGKCGEGANSITGFRMTNDKTVAMHWENDARLIVSIHGGRSATGEYLHTCTYDHSVSIVFE